MLVYIVYQVSVPLRGKDRKLLCSQGDDAMLREGLESFRPLAGKR
ncbi:hypothetical protein PL11201_700008 [Planktothrix sp. PCC 11201]|nr:hypothetical protein PL11201_700008 [Planktothrix sp. PCC 11201]